MKEAKKIKRRRRYDADFKANVLEMHKNGRSISSLSDSFGISENLIYRWKKEAKKMLFPPSSIGEREEIEQLRKQLKEVERERDILKKALSIFSRHP